MSRYPNPNNPKPGTAILLYTFGIGLIILAAIIILKGLGILPTIPGYVIWALVLLTIGIGLIGGLNIFRG